MKIGGKFIIFVEIEGNMHHWGWTPLFLFDTVFRRRKEIGF